MFGRTLKTEYVDGNRVGDHICYISNLSRFMADYPSWRITRTLDDVFEGFAPSLRPGVG